MLYCKESSLKKGGNRKKRKQSDKKKKIGRPANDRKENLFQKVIFHTKTD